MKCRFIEEYAHFQIRMFEKDMEINPDMKRACTESIEKIKNAVKEARRGRLTVNEAMKIINAPLNIY